MGRRIMPELVVSDDTGATRPYSVTDKSHAIRFASTALLNKMDRKSVESALNKWLSTGMERKLKITTTAGTLFLEYKN
jgi:hypothetical protein